MKESYPIEVAEYAVSFHIEKIPAFCWWVPKVLKKRDRILAAMKSTKYHKRTHKFGIELPKTVAEAIELDRKNNNTLWKDAIAKEMSKVRIAFKVLGEDEEITKNYQYIQCHLIFEVKLDGFIRKARFVANGAPTYVPPILTYASVVSRDTVCIALTIAALNGLEVKTSDIENAFITAPNDELSWTILGPEFGAEAGKRAFIVRALYGQKSSGGAFTRHIADCMRHLGYKPCLADPDLWYKRKYHPEGKFEYYSYALLYIDDVLGMDHDAESVLRDIDKFFKMKAGSIGDPDMYLGCKLATVMLANGVQAWSLLPSKYVQEAVKTVDKYVTEKLSLKLRKQKTSWPAGYYAELDATDEVSSDLAGYYQSIIGILHWIVEIGRVDIIMEVSTLASQMALPRQGHLDAALHIFGRLKLHHNSRMVFDPSYPPIDHNAFQTHDWTRFYGDVHEAIPDNAPEPLG